MADQEDDDGVTPQSIVEKLTSVHILDGVSASLEPEGRYGMLVFLVAGATDTEAPRKFAMTIAVEQIEPLRRFINVLARGQMVRSVNAQDHEEVLVGESVDPPGAVLSLDPGRAEQLHVHLGHAIAVKVAEMLNQRSAPRLTAAERAEFKDWKQKLVFHTQQPQQRSHEIITPDGKVHVVPGSSVH